MPKVSQEHRDARRDQVIDAALRAFAAAGFQRTSMADIIAESGLSAGAIYLQFESKQQIALAVGHRVVRHRADDVAEYLATQPLPRPDELIQLLMQGLVREIRDSRLLVQLWGEAVADPEMAQLVGEVIGEFRVNFLPYLRRWAQERLELDAAEAEAWARTMLPALLGLSQGYIVQSALIPDFDADGYLEAVRTLFP